MKLVCALVAGALTAGPATAMPAVCINTQRSYEARVIGPHDIVLQSTIGKARPRLKLTTTCVFLEKPDYVSVSSDFGCAGLGDIVVATKADGHREFCRVSHVAPFAPSADTAPVN